MTTDPDRPGPSDRPADREKPGESADGGAAQPAPPPVGGQIPSSPAPDPKAAARAYAEITGDAPAQAPLTGEPDAVATDADGPTAGGPTAGGPTAGETGAASVPGGDAEALDGADGSPPRQPLSREELEIQLAETQVALSMAEAQRDEHFADLQRTAAELQNVLKRQQRTAGVERTEGRIDVMRMLLDVLDDFDRTIQAVDGSDDPAQEGVDAQALRSGVGMVHDKLQAALAAKGLTRIGAVGEVFDPNHHEAVQQVESDDGPLDQPIVAEVYRPGYQVGDRVVRAAMVVVKQ